MKQIIYTFYILKNMHILQIQEYIFLIYKNNTYYLIILLQKIPKIRSPIRSPMRFYKSHST